MKGYPDRAICDFLEYGWPLGYCGAQLPATQPRNHASALNFAPQVSAYLQTEKTCGAMLGPFKEPLFSFITSPIQTVPKGDTDKRRIVVDLSFPPGSSVNDGIPKQVYLGQPLQLKFPGVDILAANIVQCGTGCLLFKTDLRRAYRQLPVCPLDYPLLGLYWEGEFWTDLRMPFGIRTGAMACQRTSNAVGYMYHEMGHDMVPYLDDYGVASPAAKADEAFSDLLGLINILGLEDAPEKRCPPATKMVFLGIMFDTITMTMHIPAGKVQEILLQPTIARDLRIQQLLSCLMEMGKV